MEFFWLCKQLLRYLPPLCLRMQVVWRFDALSLGHSTFSPSLLKEWLSKLWGFLLAWGVVPDPKEHLGNVPSYFDLLNLAYKYPAMVSSSVATSSILLRGWVGTGVFSSQGKRKTATF